MTEKRFTLGYEDDFLRWIRDNPNRKNYVVKIGFGEEDNLQDVCDLLNQLNNENEQLKKTLDDFKAYDNEEFREAEYINSIYKEEGFTGVIDYAKDRLQYYGVVKEVEKGLWVMVTGGWSDNEFFIHCLNNLISNFGRKHYRAYEKGGAFYYTEKPRADVEITLKKELEE